MRVLDLSTRCYLNYFQHIELGRWLVITSHDQNILEALVVISTVLGCAVTHAVELVALKGANYLARIEGACALTSIRVEERLCVAGVCSLRGWETKFLTK